MSLSANTFPTLDELVAANQKDPCRGTKRRPWPCLDGLNEKERKQAMDMLWRHLNREKKRASDRAFSKTPEGILCRKKARKKWNEANQDKIRANVERYKKSEGRVLSCQRYYQKNKSKIRARNLAYFAKNPGIRLHYGASRRARERSSSDNSAKARYAFLRSQPFNHCYYCNTKISRHELHIDHFIPIAKGGAHSAQNLVPACAKCNQTKSGKMPFKFLKGQIPLFP